MKNTVKFMAILIASASAIVGSAILQGCGTVPPGPTPGPINQQAIDAAAIVLRGAARAGAVAAITPPTGNTNNIVYFELASDGLGTFITGKDYSPAALQKDLMSVGGSTLQNVYVQLAIGTVVDLYSVYYQQYVQNNVASNAPVVVEFATSIQDGFNQAIGRQALRLIGHTDHTGRRPQLGPVLPRPCPGS